MQFTKEDAEKYAEAINTLTAINEKYLVVKLQQINISYNN